jgi:hypothetical protein
MKHLNLPGPALLFLLLPLFAGCEFVFTGSLFSFAQRDPSKMTFEQQINFAKEALASGDRDAMEDAYDVLEDDAADTSDGDLQLLVAQLAMELCGFSDVLDDVLSGTIDFSGDPTDPGVISDVDSSVGGLDSSYLEDAADLYTKAEANGADMDATDYLIGAMVLLAKAIDDTASDTLAEVDRELPARTAAERLLDGYFATADPDDPSYSLIDEFNTFLGQIPDLP